MSIAAAHALDEDAQAREELAHGLAGQATRGVDPVGAHLDAAVGREHAGVLPGLAAAHLLLVLGAGRRQVDADQLRADLRQHDRRADRAEDVRDGVADRNRVGVGLRLLGGQAEPS